ncbi:MAG: hypothetical protein A2161_18395 [Candidatus Schekmanbacteria bacterium RBG_13_48_7]|uniref:Uncharacterized protein n=1 Tax=Candidatus Schekmanbacteria bacterium RBG_13_48_7 TaxID=1817878 RepID=A0A1F7RX64_9BACT|nr:MAG: hypothetical protein A2161_18395 [Candidatus Schekmanbacteria bacterium RBG_13_48_7]
MYVANEDSHDVTVIDATTLTVAVPSITLPPHGTGNATPRDVDIDLQGTYVYIPSGDINYGTVHDYVYVIAVGTHLLASSIDINPHRNPNVVAVAPQMYECAGSVTPTPTPLTIPVINLCLTMFLLLSMPACMCLKKTGIPLFKILLKNLRF